MYSGTNRLFGENTRLASFGFSPYAAVVSLACLFWGLFSNMEVYGNAEYGFSLLALLGTVGGLGYLAAHVYRSTDPLALSFSVLGGIGLLESQRSESILVGSAEWPLLVALLFGPFSTLLAGLGGWV